MKRILAFTLAALLLFAFVPMGMRAHAAALPTDGKYTLFTTEYMGRQLSTEAWQTSGSILLNKDGKGKLVNLGEEMEISGWTEKDGLITMFDESGDPLTAGLKDGIIELEMSQGLYYYYAREGVDTKGFVTSGHPTGSMLFEVFRSIDGEKGAHLRYTTESNNSNPSLSSSSSFDSHAKNGDLIVLRLTKVTGGEQLTASLTLDGSVYQLYPREKRGSVVIASLPSYSLLNLLQQDELYRAMAARAMRTDYRVETRTVDGVSCRVEVYPAADYTAEAAFYFDKDGQLVRVVEGPPPSTPSLGETLYTVASIDEKVNESLFDISGFKISK